MKIANILVEKKLTVSFEIFPPKAHEAVTPVVDAVKKLAELPCDFISVTCGAGGSTRAHTAAVAAEIEKCGIPALAHQTCIGSSRAEIDANIAALKQAGIGNVLALRGDIPAGGSTTPGLAFASDLVPILTKAGFCVGGACYPEGHPESRNRDEDLDNVKRKVDSGAEFLTTQMFFDNDMLYSFLYRLQSKGVHVPVLAGIMPIVSAPQIKRMIALSNAYMPRKLLAVIDRFSGNPDAIRQAGIAYAIDQIIDLISNGVRGIHLYTMNKPETVAAIISAIDHIIAASNTVL